MKKDKLKKKQEKKAAAIEKRRNAARLNYPVDVRIDLAVKKQKDNQ